MGSWQLYIRHAHRETVDPEADNGLSEKGRAQGQALVRELARRSPLRKPSMIYSSPKLRCLETAAYVAEWAGLPVVEDERIDTRHPHETEKTFLKRLQDFWASERSRGEACYVTHGDVLPFLGEWGGLGPVDVRKGSYFWLELDG